MVGDGITPVGGADTQPVMDPAQQKLWQRLDDCLYEHFDYLKGLGRPELEDISVFAATVEMHSYLKDSHAFQEGEIDRLLQFQNPLAVALDASEQNLDTDSFDINGLLDDMNANDTHPLWHDPDAPLALLPALMEKLDAEMDKRLNSWLVKEPETLVKMAAEIDATGKCYDTFRNYDEYDGALVEHLLKFQNPLEVLVDHWPDGVNVGEEMSFIMENLWDDARSDLEEYALTSDDADVLENQPEVPASLHDRLEAAKREIAERPAPEGGQRDDTVL